MLQAGGAIIVAVESKTPLDRVADGAANKAGVKSKGRGAGEKVTGPRGGVTTNTGKTNVNRETIYKRDSSGYYSKDSKTGKQKIEKSPNKHGNTAGDQDAECYNLTCRKTGEVKKIGETTRDEDAFGKDNQRRYTKEELKQKNVRYKKTGSGTKGSDYIQ